MSAISIEGLSKRYILRHNAKTRDGLRHAIEEAVKSPLRWLRERRESRSNESEEFWALRDISFEVTKGEAVAIIGRNGAGKSTLLKVLSRITEPTTGRIRLKGRVASLLEVGTGFHQELTGRENIYLNGAILGMTKVEIKKRFDEIVAFSEVEKFLDTPVKRYSSGMYVRLAFAVAAHLEPEILIVDEVLAVGDGAFQTKCLGRMEDVAKDGRTVLFVSHNMAAVQALCSSAVYLKNGKVQSIGSIAPIVSEYLQENTATVSRRRQEALPLGASLKLLSFDFSPSPVESGARLEYRLMFRCDRDVTVSELSILINTTLGARVALIDLRSIGLPVKLRLDEEWTVEGTIESLNLIEGDYSAGITVNTGEFWENVFDISSFTVVAKSSSTGIAPYPAIYRGVVELTSRATHTKTSAAETPSPMESVNARPRMQPAT